MREKKKKSLEAKGWRVGSAEEFLELTAEEMAYLDLKLRFAESLRKRRQRRKLTQVDVARLISSSQSRVAKMEAGDPSGIFGPARAVLAGSWCIEAGTGQNHRPVPLKEVKLTYC